MKITVSTFNDLVFEVNVADDIELENFKAFCELECGISSSKFMILFNQSPLNDLKKPMKDYGVKDGDCLLLQQLAPTTNNSNFFHIFITSVTNNVLVKKYSKMFLNFVNFHLRGLTFSKIFLSNLKLSIF